MINANSSTTVGSRNPLAGHPPVSLDMEDARSIQGTPSQLRISYLEKCQRLASVEAELADERATAKMRERFLAVLGHDLREPARSISCLTELLLLRSREVEVHATATLIRDSARRMVRLIDSMVDLARGTQGQGWAIQLSKEESLEPFLRTVISEFQTCRASRHLDVVFDLNEPVTCDRERLAQLFSNLLSNAFIHGAEHEAVRVHVSSGGGNFRLEVRNSGNPIPPAALPRIFEPLYQCAEGAKRNGLGLGLYIANEIAVAHHGELSVTSTARETCFTFSMESCAATTA